MVDIKVQVETAQKTRADGADGISKKEYEAIKANWKSSDPQSAASQKWLEQKQPALAAALQSDLDYSGYTGTAIGSLNSTRAGDELKQDARQREAKLDKLTPQTNSSGDDNFGKNGLAKVTDKTGKHDQVWDDRGVDDAGKKMWSVKNGTNETSTKGDPNNLRVPDAEAAKSRQTQKDFCTKMSGVIGTDISNPPSANASKGYFQSMADKGATPAEIKTEYDSYLKTFYKHPGKGSSWDPQLDPKSPNFASQVKDAPITNDGKRLLDCKSIAAMSENDLGGVKGKDGKPMFDVMHAESGEHKVTGFFPHGGDPRDGFVVDNTAANTTTARPTDKDWAKTTDPEARKRYMMRSYMTVDAKEATPSKYGSTATDMRFPPS